MWKKISERIDRIAQRNSHPFPTQRSLLSGHCLDSTATERRWQILMIKSHTGCRVSYRTLLTELDALLASALESRLDPEVSLQARASVLKAVHAKRCTYRANQSFLSWLSAITDYKIRGYISSYSAAETAADPVPPSTRRFAAIDRLPAAANQETDSEVVIGPRATVVPHRQRIGFAGTTGPESITAQL